MYSHEMMQCRHGKVCYAFQRLNGGGYRLDDRCHCAIYKHPSRRDNAHIEKTLDSKKFISAPLRVEFHHCNGMWAICDNLIHLRKKVIKFKNSSELGLNEKELMKEIKKNRFEWVMLIPKYSGLFGIVFSKISPVFEKNPKTLWDIAKEKMEHPRHIEMGKPLTLVEILAILLYTGTDVYRDLRHDEMLYWKEFALHADPCFITLELSHSSKRKWPVLSTILSLAINKLDRFDITCKPHFTYHGLHDVNVDPQTFDVKYQSNDSTLLTKRPVSDAFMYGTFVSTSTDKEVALEFMKSDHNKHNGCLMEIGLHKIGRFEIMRCIGADVSWISKFPYEKEFLFDKCQGFRLISNDFHHTEGYQIVRLVDLS